MENFSTDEHVPPTSQSIDEALGENRGAEQGDANNQQAEAPRKLAGLTAGRIVNFVMKGGCARPLLVVNPCDGIGIVNGVLFFDGLNDVGNFPANLGAPLVRDSYGRTLSSLWASGVGYDETGSLEGTWHWPTKQAVVASGMDAAAFNALLDARVALIEEDLTKKLNATVETVNAALDSNNKLLKELLTPGPLPVRKESLAVVGEGEKSTTEPEAAQSGEKAESATGGTTS